MNVVLLVVTGLSLLVAGFMSAIAWRMSREERWRSDARVAELSSAIYGDGDHEPATARLFDKRPAASSFRSVAAAAAGACVIAAVAGLGVTAARAPRHTTGAAPRIPDAPLELLALEHERVSEQLIVRGIVRNPPESVDRIGLTAVVMVFGHGGGLLSSGRASVPAVTLAPGGTTPFVVTVPEAADVDRFRLSFRTDARVEPHVDRRAHVDRERDLAP